MQAMDHVDRLTALLGCSQSTISKYEKRRAQYSIEDIIRLCRFYKVSADYVLGLPDGLTHPER